MLNYLRVRKLLYWSKSERNFTYTEVIQNTLLLSWGGTSGICLTSFSHSVLGKHWSLECYTENVLVQKEGKEEIWNHRYWNSHLCLVPEVCQQWRPVCAVMALPALGTERASVVFFCAAASSSLVVKYGEQHPQIEQSHYDEPHQNLHVTSRHCSSVNPCQTSVGRHAPGEGANLSSFLWIPQTLQLGKLTGCTNEGAQALRSRVGGSDSIY